MTTSIAVCPLCKSHAVRSHCDSVTCTWWRCLSCTSYGDNKRAMDFRMRGEKS